MKKWLLLVLGTVTVLALGVAMLNPYRRLYGLLRGDPFYDGKPTTFWSKVVRVLDQPPPARPAWVQWLLRITGQQRPFETPNLRLLEAPPEAVPVLAELQRDPVATVRWRATLALVHGGHLPARDALPVLTEALLRWQEFPLREQVLDYFYKLGPEAAPALPALGRGLAGGRGDSGIVSVLAHIGPAAVPQLDWALHLAPACRRFIYEVLGGWGRQARGAVATLEAQLRDSDLGPWAAYALGRIEPENAKVLPALIDLLDQPDSKVREDALEVLFKLRSPATTQALVAALTHQSPAVRAGAAEALGNLISEALPAVPALCQAVKDSEPDVRYQAIAALRRICMWEVGSAQAAVPALAGALADGDSTIRAEAAHALGDFGSKARAAVPALRRALHDPDEAVRREAARSLASVLPESAAPQERP